MDIHQVVQQNGPDSPVYVVKKENGNGKACTLNRNLLLPCPDLPSDDQPHAAHQNTHGAVMTKSSLHPPTASKKYHTRQSAPQLLPKDPSDNEDELPTVLPSDLPQVLPLLDAPLNISSGNLCDTQDVLPTGGEPEQTIAVDQNDDLVDPTDQVQADDVPDAVHSLEPDVADDIPDATLPDIAVDSAPADTDRVQEPASPHETPLQQSAMNPSATSSVYL